MESRAINNWSQVVQTLTKAGNNINKSFVDTQRKEKYRKELQKQISRLNEDKNRIRASNQRQRQQIVNQSKQEKRIQFEKKANRRKKQQWYQLQNLQLLSINRKNKNNLQAPQNNPLFQLEDNDRKRRKQTRRHFQLQNLMNKKQSQIQHNLRASLHQIELKQKDAYNNYVENQFSKKEQDRKLWENKYLFDQSVREVGKNSKDYHSAYKSYLKWQMEEDSKKRRHQNSLIDGEIKKINQRIENVTSSPAYLGLSQSYDRRKQMRMVDKSLNFSPHESVTALDGKRNKIGRIVQIDDRNERREIERKLEKVDQSKQNRYEDNGSERQRKVKKYTSYDFISGIQKIHYV